MASRFSLTDEMPPPPVDVGGEVTKLATGRTASCALLVGGELRCWGKNSQGLLCVGHNQNIGDGPNEMPPSPALVGGSVLDVVMSSNACALLNNGVVRCWGDGALGVNANGSTGWIGTNLNSLPPNNSDLGGPATFLANGAIMNHLCAVLEDHTVRCWGSGAGGALGHGNSNSIGANPQSLPPDPVPVF